MTRRQELIETAARRLLTVDEAAELVALWWTGTAAEFDRTVRQAYALDRQYQRDPRPQLRELGEELLGRLGHSEWRVLFRARDLLAARRPTPAPALAIHRPGPREY